MEYFYDGQVRRYVTQFMRIFIGFQYKTGDGTLRHVPVNYGDMTRQVASIIRENSENKLPSVPKIACYISGLEMDTTRLADASFVSKVQVRERAYDFDGEGDPVYANHQGAGYTVERLMPTPFNLSMKAEIWTSNTDQKLQLLEQILVLFNPSLEIQTTDNYIDWTSLSVVDLKSVTFSSRTIPAGPDSDIDICAMEFTMPIYITPPAKVKKMGVVRNLIMNIFNDSGDILSLEEIIYNQEGGDVRVRNNYGDYSVLLLKSGNGIADNFDVSLVDSSEVVSALGLDPPAKQGDRLDWNSVLDQHGGFLAGISKIYFLQADGNELGGTFVVNEVDPTYLLVSLDMDGRHGNDFIIDAIIDPYKYNPKRPNGEIVDQSVAIGTKFLMLDDVNNSVNVGQTYGETPYNSAYDGPDAWKNSDGNDPVIKANSIIEWSGSAWVTIFDPSSTGSAVYAQNLRTGIQYRWDGTQWLKSFEGVYAPGYWRFDLDPQ